MEVPQVYLFRGLKELNVFIHDNCHNMTVENIKFEFVVESVFFIFLTAKVQVEMCDEMWKRYAEMLARDA